MENHEENLNASFSSPLDQDEWEAIARRLELTPRQTEVVGLILHGKRDKQIATELGLSVRTVREHLSHLFERLGVNDRMELVLHIFSASRMDRRK